MIYGLPEVDSENIPTPVDLLVDGRTSTQSNNRLLQNWKEKKGKVRPVRLDCQNHGDIEFALVHSRKLKYSA